ncbi:MAG: exonuclease subunit SbcD [Treponema sp.]|nr:exonuclease subunit SbcD [Treponema sp.]
MKFLQTSDWHLGKLFFEHSLYEDQKDILSRIELELYQESKTDKPYDALLIPGDIYDRGIPPSEATSLFGRFLTNVHTHLPQLHIFILSGNHDNAERLSFVKELLASHNIHLCTDCQDISKPVIVGDVAVYQIPYLHAGDLSHNGCPLRTQQDLYAEAFAMLTRYHKEKYPDLQSLVCAHLFAAGALKSDSERLTVGTVEQVDASLFSDVSYVALGHLHRYQKASHNAYYSGSPLCYSFDERQTAKCMLRGVLDNGSLSVEQVLLQPLHDCVELEDSFKNLQESAVYDQYADCYVSIVCTDTIPVMDPVPLLRKRFHRLLSFKYKSLGGKTTLSLSKRRNLLSDTSSNSFLSIFDNYIADIHDSDQLETSPLLQKERDLFVSYLEKFSTETKE